MTGFAAKVVDTEMARAFDLLSDMLLNPRFDEDDLQKEQKVIIEEMKMIEDTPDELLVELFHAAYFPDHSLGRPIEGTEETVSSFDRSITADFHAQTFVPRNLVVAAAGNVTHDELLGLVMKTFGAQSEAPDIVSDSSVPQVAAPDSD
jgi:predicted Zn-dependent peptidase